MKLTWWAARPVKCLGVLALSAGISGAAADDAQLPDDLKWIAIHAGCVVSYSDRFAATKEPPSDIATAGLVACRSYLEESLTKKTPLRGEARQQVIADLEEKARRLAIRGILEKRYPTPK